MSYVNLMAETSSTTVNGPGNRYMVHFQGCNLGCKKCFNPESWSFKVKNLVDLDDLVNRIFLSNCDGLGISGGEPFLQPAELLELLKKIHKNSLVPFKNGILVYSGFYEEELKSIKEYSEILSMIDLIISGRFEYQNRVFDSLLSSSNQKYIWNHNENRGKSLIKEDSLNSQNYEIIIDKSSLKLSGFMPDWDKNIIETLKLDGVSFEK